MAEGPAPAPDGRRVTLRPATADDRAFLLGVYGTTRADELALVQWTEGEKRAFVEMQFDAQDRHYRGCYPHASFDAVVVDGEPAGRLYVNRAATEIRIVDVTILPAHRNRGLGTVLLQRLMDEARATGRALSVHVEAFNPARRLYDRLGFALVVDRGAHLLLEWRSEVGPAAGTG